MNKFSGFPNPPNSLFPLIPAMYLNAKLLESLIKPHFRLASILLSGFLLPATLPAQQDSASVLEAEVAAETQTGRIEGRVFNTQTGRYVGRARIELQPAGRVVFSNAFGEYEFYNVPTGTVTLRLTYTGQEDEMVQVEVRANEIIKQDFTLLSGRTISRGRGEAGQTKEQVFELEEFVVDSADSFESLSQVAIQEERFSVNLKSVVSADAYGIVAQGNVGEFVKFLPGVTIDYGGTYTSGADANAIRIRGYDASQTRVTIDGIPVANAQPGTLDPAVGLDMLSINNASRVEVIKVPSPDQPGAGVGGTVNLISKTAFEYPEPSLRLRVYLNMNSENLDIFEKQPGPMNKDTYRTLPGFDLSYNYPLNENLGFTVSLASVNQANENHTLKTDWDSDPDWGIPNQRGPGSTFTVEAAQGSNRRYHHWLTEDPSFSDWQAQYGEDWSQWDESAFEEIYIQPAADADEAREALRQVKRIPVYDSDGNLIGAQSEADIANKPDNLPVFFDAEGNRVGYTFWDSAHPWLNNVGITDSPRISKRNSGSIKFDWRPLEGLVLTANAQASTFEAEDAGRRFEMKVGNRSGIREFGPDYIISRDGRGGSDLNLTALDREGLSYSGYLKAEYIKGPWNIRAHISKSYSEGDLKSIENGHFSGLDTNMGNIDRAEFHDIGADGYPQEVLFYTYEFDEEGNKIGESLLDPADLSNYNISGIDPDDPQASRLRVLAGNSHTEDTITTAKFDLKRDLDFLPFDSFNLAIKIGADYESQEQVKSGRGTTYGFQFLGQAGIPLKLDDFLDENYIGVEPGFGFGPREWPDLFKMYDFFQENPGVFSDTFDTPFTNAVGEVEGNTIAADNYNSFASQNKSITETTTAYYTQLEGQFLNNRLSVVAGFRYSEQSRKGRRALEDSDWNRLRLDRDANNDGFLDIIRDLEGFADQIPAPFDQEYDTLPAFSVVDPPELTSALQNFNADSFVELPANIQQLFRDFWAVYEQAGAVFNDGTPFDADTFIPLTDGTLA
ncbi:MAG TPA: TonB-dependent receptor plug domain-containing protein, partial [Oceanipulchritudo sp.]|nr:TonB-dependent receptor plug domain-containing protein [Oceanipulchritudo sp.]